MTTTWCSLIGVPRFSRSSGGPTDGRRPGRPQRVDGIEWGVRLRDQSIDAPGVHDGERKVYPVVVDELHDGGEPIVDAAHLFQRLGRDLVTQFLWQIVQVAGERADIGHIGGRAEEVDSPAIAGEGVANVLSDGCGPVQQGFDHLRRGSHWRDHAVDVAIGEAVKVPARARTRRTEETGGGRLSAVVVEAVVERA